TAPPPPTLEELASLLASEGGPMPKAVRKLLKGRAVEEPTGPTVMQSDSELDIPLSLRKTLPRIILSARPPARLTALVADTVVARRPAPPWPEPSWSEPPFEIDQAPAGQLESMNPAAIVLVWIAFVLAVATVLSASVLAMACAVLAH